ncbi:conserved hypothetical protein [Ricinus communis]|uniref:Uncharacterized protein n=1 Tax=Ricinus communis TaxID=3988 RepID=B9T1X6_RICCO|nr:conserved hypothetical protein [Ricinus communis]
MAAPAVGWAINKLDTLLTGEVKLLRNVHTELQGIRDELESIESFLKDADLWFYQENVDSRFKTWVKQVARVAFQIEDVIDEYMLHVARHRDQHGFLHKITRLVTKLKIRHRIDSKIQDLKKSVRVIRERSDRYNFNSSSEQGSSDRHNTRHDPRVLSLFIEEAELVGIESPKSELTSRLVEGASEIAAISLVGMGGLGKTTLAKKVYDSKIVTAHFDCKAWITVSQSYKEEELLRTMIRKLQRENMLPAFGINMINELSLIPELREYLKEKRYMVIFDDVWGIDFWEYIMTALPDNDFNLCLKEKPMSSSAKKVFRSNGGNCPSQLEQLSHAIEKKCEAEGFIKKTYGRIAEEVAEEYFNELVNRSLVQVEKFSVHGNDAMQVLQALPNLQELRFYEGYNGEQLHFRKRCFSVLRILYLHILTQLNKLIIEKGALPAIEELIIGGCPELKELPTGMASIRRDFAMGMQPIGGHEYWKVEHIPLIIFYYKAEGFRFISYNLGDGNLLKRLEEDSK